ncbi:uncharacterized protein LOC111352613 [Spodoptera litura]|uniref:Uncharacterized protein LOC111352613 n=1 Tax=Spodoptera litura TaxID=69820 RepID=A0A9J7E2F8_SPOLT|nr:uncharacterized protein LOC111352613 [Spodoptera litura]
MSCTTVAALALLLLLAAVTAVTVGDEPPACAKLNRFNIDKELYKGSLREGGTVRPLHLYWGSAAGRAASTLLLVLLRHLRGYDSLSLMPGPLSTTQLARYVPHQPDHRYKSWVIALSTAWVPEPAQPWVEGNGSNGGLAGPRLAEFGLSPVSARRRLFVWLAPHVRTVSECMTMQWPFDIDETTRLRCGFIDPKVPRGNRTQVEVLSIDDIVTLDQLLKRAHAAKSPLLARDVNYTVFFDTLRTANHSFLFLDYDIWSGEPGVRAIEPPPCVHEGSKYCIKELDTAISLRIADVEKLQVYAPMLFKFVHDFDPEPEALRYILEEEARGTNIEAAACAWVDRKKVHYCNHSVKEKYDIINYEVALYVCVYPTSLYDPSYDELAKDIIYIFNHEKNTNISIRRFFVNCSDTYNMSKKLTNLMDTMMSYRMLGVVSMATGEGALEASTVAAANNVPLLLVDVVPDDSSAEAGGTTWRVSGSPRHLARALAHFILAAGWTRLAVLSEDTLLARQYNAAVKLNTTIVSHEFQIPTHLTDNDTDSILDALRTTKARVIFINAIFEAATSVLKAAVKRNMTYSNGFVWIMRDWKQNNETVCDSEKHFTVSFWSHSTSNNIKVSYSDKPVIRQMHKHLRNYTTLPRAAAFMNAHLTLVMGFKDLNQQFRVNQDLRNAYVIRSFNESLIKSPITGVPHSHPLRYKNRVLEDTYVYIEEWCGGQATRGLATWRVNITSGAVSEWNASTTARLELPDDMPHDDGTSSCRISSGDPFDPTCYDAVVACVLLLLPLALVAVLLARRRLARLAHEQQIHAIARRQRVATVLADYLVERDTLELHSELGAGRFGSVRLARLCRPGRNPRYVAAKALRDNAAPADESEFLREACMIASLDHTHIVRLVGVCIADGPPLVLMELAFFGDLLGYLRARRHLVDGTALEESAESDEAEHVSAETLTRLAREAAEALQYLEVRGVVHRDVRAANCLVDKRRSLKLADFGMARDTVAGADGASEYSCRRRGLFPVLWMAPESLAHGVFSAASDVWAFGVLVLELVTLGARPYGAMSPLRVLEYVAAGGSPPLPLDATQQTRGLAQLCWQRAAERRPSAAELAAYLAAWPRALHPVLMDERDADSGFGESPSTELLPPESPAHTHDQLDVLAATH